MSQPTDLRKLLIELRDFLRDRNHSMWSYVESGTQAEDMANLADRIDAALAEVVEPVAWMHRSLTHPQYDGGIHPEKRDGWEHVPLYSSPVSGLRAGMLQAAFIVKDHYWDSLRKDQVVKAHIEGIVKAITKAADQVNAEGQRIGVLAQSGSHESRRADNTDGLPESPVVVAPSAPHSASEPDTVAVPREQLEHWAEYWNRNVNEKSMTDALEHILDEIDAVLQAAQEAK